MKITLLFLGFAVFIGIVLPYLCLVYTRIIADWIIAGKKPSGPNQLNRYIWTLRTSSRLLFGVQQIRDIYRMDKLRDIRNDLYKQQI